MDDVGYSAVWWDPDTGAERFEGPYCCTGRCVQVRDIMMPGDVPLTMMDEVAYPDPACPMHGGSDAWVTDTRPAWIACDQAMWRLADAYSEGLIPEPT